jgi:hypothetical protein
MWLRHNSSFLAHQLLDWMPLSKKTGMPRSNGHPSAGNSNNTLPDEFIHHAMSCLTPQETAQTCVLPRRWQNGVTIPLDTQLLAEGYRVWGHFWVQGTSRRVQEEEGAVRPCQGSSVRVQVLRHPLCSPWSPYKYRRLLRSALRPWGCSPLLAAGHATRCSIPPTRYVTFSPLNIRFEGELVSSNAWGLLSPGSQGAYHSLRRPIT